MGISSKRIYTSSILNNSLYYFGATVLGLLISLLGFRFYCNNFVIKSINDFENMQNNTLFDSTSANSVNLNLEVNIPAIAIIILFGYIVVNIFTKKSCKNSLRS